MESAQCQRTWTYLCERREQRLGEALRLEQQRIEHLATEHNPIQHPCVYIRVKKTRRNVF